MFTHRGSALLPHLCMTEPLTASHTSPCADDANWQALLRWQGQPRWHLLNTDFAQGQHLLQTWAAWQTDPQRPAQLHYTALCAQAPSAQTVQDHAATAHRSLAAELAQHLWGLLPGVHRIALAQGQLLLTLWIGPPATLLRQQHTQADAVLLHGAHTPGASTDEAPPAPPSPAALLWDAHSIKALARQCRRDTQLLITQPSAALQATLRTSGFVCDDPAPTGSQPALLQARYAPHWQLRPRADAQAGVTSPGHAVVIGAGLSGAAAAYSLAQRGWTVQVLALGSQPADGASGLPAGLFCPHVSPDDSVLSRLSRSGVRMTLQRLQALCRAGEDWAHSGVLEHCTDGGTGLPPSWTGTPGHDWSQPATATQRQAAQLPDSSTSCWHAQAGWVRPAQLVQAQLRHPRITFVPQCDVQQLQRTPDGIWQACNAQGQLLAQGTLAVLACGPATNALLPSASQWPLQSIRGQITWGLHQPQHAHVLPPFPVNGNGNLVTHVPLESGRAWVMGSTFERDVTELPIAPSEQAAAHATNWDKLRTLLPASAQAMAPWFDPAQPECRSTWGQVRCASHDRLPIVGPVDAAQQPQLWAITAMGARGLTLSVLCGEVLAAQLHGEPLPLDAKLAQHLSTQRLQARRHGAPGIQ